MEKRMLIIKPRFPLFWLISFYILGFLLLYATYQSYIQGSPLFAVDFLLSISLACFALGLIIYSMRRKEAKWVGIIGSIFERTRISDDKIILPETLLVKPALLIFESRIVEYGARRLKYRITIDAKGDAIYSNEIKCWGIENFRFLDSFRASLLVLPGWIVEDAKYSYGKNKLFIGCLYPADFEDVEKTTVTEYDGNVVKLNYRISGTSIEGNVELLSYAEEEKAKSIMLRVSSIFESVGKSAIAIRDITSVDRDNRKAEFKEVLFPEIKNAIVLFLNTNDRLTILRLKRALNLSFDKDIILGFNDILVELVAKGKIFADIFHTEKVRLTLKKS